MSHFVVLVIGDDVEKQLAPYQENNMGDCPAQFLEFQDRTDDVTSGWDDEMRSKYATIAEYAEDYHGYRERRVIDGVERFGYMENPNKKWDWWVIGGRWSGMLPTAAGGADSATKAEIDWNRKRDESEERARARFARWKQALDLHPETARPRSWSEVLAAHGNNVEAARAAYNTQPQIASWKRIEEAVDRWGAFDIEPVTDLGFDIDALVTLERRKAAAPFAFVLDGKWHERGRMGWSACVSGEQPVDAWLETWERTWEALPPDARITVVDCHI